MPPQAYISGHSSEVAAYHQEFLSAATLLVQTLNDTLAGLVGAATASAAVWALIPQTVGSAAPPNVSYSGFAALSGVELPVSKARAISWNPVVTAQQRAGWEAWAEANDAVAAGPFAAVSGSKPMFNIHSLHIWQRAPNGSRVTAAEAAFYLPVWQIAPLNTSDSNQDALMYNLHSEPARRAALEQVFASGQPCATALIQLVQDGPSVNGSISRASAIVFAPVFGPGSVATQAAAGPPAPAGAGTPAGPPANLVGTTSVVYTWDKLFNLPSSTSSVEVFLSMQGYNNYTFHVAASGRQVSNMGVGDLHTARYAQDPFPPPF